MDLATIRSLFGEFLDGAASRDNVQVRIADARLQLPALDPDLDDRRSAEELLALNIGEAFCRFQDDDEVAHLFARRILRCLDQVSDLEDVVDLLPAITHHDRFAIIVSKHARGLISRPGFRSVVSKTFTFDVVRPWLEEASPDRLVAFVDAIEKEQFQAARSMLLLPPA